MIFVAGDSSDRGVRKIAVHDHAERPPAPRPGKRLDLRWSNHE
jgi:hypothetical protein